MNNNYQTEVGYVASVSGNDVSIQLLEEIKSNMPIIEGIVYRVGQIGSFIKIPLGYSVLYGIVTQIGAAAIPEEILETIKDDYSILKNNHWLKITLIGEQIGGKFDRGVSQSPTTGDKAHIVTTNDLNIIYGGYDEKSSINVGNISFSENLIAKIDLNKLISRHSAILGSTGSGKSNSVGVILNEIAKKAFRSSRIIVIDPHGEYNQALEGESIIYKINSSNNLEHEKELVIPYWALPFNELIKIFPGNLNDNQKEYIRDKVWQAKINSIEANGLEIEPEMISADSPLPFNIKKLWYELDSFERKTYDERGNEDSVQLETLGDYNSMVSDIYKPAGLGSSKPYMNNLAKGILSFLEGMRLRIKDSSYKFLFEPGDFTPDENGKITKDLGDLLYNWVGGNSPISIIDLSGVPSEITMSISGTILNIIYDTLFWGQNMSIGGKKQPLLVVLEEAHNYLKHGEESIASRTVQKIAKEGRKYGVGLMLVTQRPSELDETVLSQCGTIVALRMNNSKDRSHIKASIQDELQTMIDLLPALRTGEAIISGEGVKIPSRIKFSKLAYAPKSADPKASERWLINNGDVMVNYGILINNWRKKIIEEENND